MTDAAAQNALIRRAVLLCIATTLTVALLELAVGWVFGLLSIFAEGLHTTADLADSLVALVLVLLAARPPDQCHPYGHGKYDSFAAIFEGLMVGVSGVWAIVMATRVLAGFAGADPRPGAAALVAMAAACIVYWAVSAYVLQLAKSTQSPAVFAEGAHLRTHIYVTAGLVVGVCASWAAELANWAHADRIDPAIALLLGVYLVIVGVRIVRAGYVQLIDTALPPDELAQLAACLEGFRDEFIEVHAVRSRQSGADRHVDIHLVVPGEMTVTHSHDLAHRIEAAIQQEMPTIRLLVYVEPAVGAVRERYAARGKRGAVVLGHIDTEQDHHDAPRAHGGVSSQ